MDLNDLTVENIGAWPWFLKFIVILIACTILTAFSFFAFIKPKLENLTQIDTQQGELKAIFELKQYQAASLEAYKQQLVEMRLILKGMMTQLTTPREIPILIERLSRIGIANGLEFKLIRPEKEVDYEFYAELPIQISVEGKYHDIASFISEVSTLQKIVTFNDFTIRYVDVDNRQRSDSGAEPQGAGKELIMESIARTYRYIEKIDDDEEEE